MKKLILIIYGLFMLFNINLAQAEDELPIAAIFAKTGEASEDNLELFQAIRFAVEEVNSKGGLHGKKIKLMEYDNHSTPIQSKLAAKQAVQDGALAVIGASWSSHSLAIAPYLQKMKVPMITPDSTHPDITKIGNYIFRTCADDTWQGKALAIFSRETLKLSTSVILQNITSDYSLGLAAIFKDNFTKMGGEVSAVFNYKSQQTDFTELLTKVKTLNPEIIFIPGHAESGYIVRQAQNMGIEAKMLGGDGWPYRQFYANGGQDLKEGYYTAHWNKYLKNQKAKSFIARYKNFYDVGDFVVTAYDAAMLLFDAIKRADSLDRESIRNAIANTKDFAGVTGKITLDDNGNTQKPLVIMKISNGRPAFLTTIKPAG